MEKFSEKSLRAALTGLSLSMLLSSLGTSSVNVALPTLVKVFNVSVKEVQWIVLGYLLAITTLIIGVGRFGDMVGRRKLLLSGLGLFTLASALCGIATSFWMMIAARAVQGLGAAIMMALSLAFVGDTVSKEKTGSVMGLLGAMSAIGTALGPSLGGILISTIGWQAIFYVNVPLGILAIFLAYRYLPIDRLDDNKERIDFDKVGTVVLVLTLAAYTLAATMGKGSFGWLNIALLCMTIFGVGLFIFVEKRARSPLIQLATLRNPILSAGLVTSLLVSTVLMTTLVVGPFYLSHGLLLNVVHIGIIMSIGPFVVAVASVMAGRMADRFGHQRVTIVGLMGIAVGSLALSIVPMTFGIPGYIAPLVVITLGYALFQTANNTAVMQNVRPDQRGLISGILNLSRNLGLITGASFMGAVFVFGSGAGDLELASPNAVSVGMRITYGVGTVLMVLACAVAVASRRLNRF